jgi:hypothetical protein
MAIYSAGTSVANAGSLVGAGDSTDHQAVGTYHLSNYQSGTTLAVGATTAGSNLNHQTGSFHELQVKNNSSMTNTGYSGTWRNMAESPKLNGPGSECPTTLFVRVS